MTSRGSTPRVAEVLDPPAVVAVEDKATPVGNTCST